MQRGRMAMADRFFADTRLIDVVQGKGDLDQFLLARDRFHRAPYILGLHGVTAAG